MFLLRCVFVLLALIATTTAGAASEGDSFNYDNQPQLKKAYEAAKAHHARKIHGSLYNPPQATSASKKQNENSFLSSFTKKNFAAPTAEKSLFQKIQDFLSEQIHQRRDMVDSLKRTWRSLQGIKSIPPVVSAFVYIYGSAGSMPEVYWVPDGAMDPDGTIDRFEFDFGDGTTQVIPYEDFDTVGFFISHIYPSAGTYYASVKVVDNTGDHTTYYNTLNLNTTNKMPVPKFTFNTNQSPNFLKVNFTSQATDSDGSLIRYGWRFGDASPDYVGGAFTTASRTYAAPGAYDVRLQVRDNVRAQTTSTTRIYVGQTPPPGGSPPLTIIDANTFAGTAPLTVNFDGEKSFDIEGSSLKYKWDFGDFSSPLNISYQSKPSYIYTQPGTYYGALTTTDSAGQSATRYFNIYVLPASGTPLAARILSFPLGDDRQFQFGSGVNVAGAPIPTNYYIWDFGDGSAKVRSPYPVHTYSTNGTYTVTLKAYDLRGGYQMVQKQISVDGNQSAPPSYFLENMNNVGIGTEIEFVTQNPQGVASTTLAHWNFGDGTMLSGLHEDLLNVAHTYTTKGLYPVTLTVTDADGKTGSFTSLMVIQDTGSPVDAKIKFSQRFGPVPFPVRLDGGTSTSSAGTIAKYYWHTYGPNGEYISESAVTTPIFTAGGEHYVNLFVQDNQGNVGLARETLSAIDEAAIPPGNQLPVAQITLEYLNLNNPASIRVSGFNSFDPDGDRIVQYEWNFDGSPVSGFPEAYLMSADNEEHRIALRVTDKWGAVGEAKVTFRNPVVDYITAPDRPVVDGTVYFFTEAEMAYVPGRTIVEHKWDFGDGSGFAYGTQANHVYTAAGTYQIKLILKDDLNRTYTKEKSITVEVPQAPTVVIRAQDGRHLGESISPDDFYWSEMPIEVEFDLNGSSAQGMGLSNAVWDFGDGNSGFGLQASYEYQKPGTYTVTVTATDKQGLSNTDSMDIHVGKDNCSDVEGVEGCLVLNNSQGHVLPMTLTEWGIGHDAGTQDWEPEVGDTDFATLVSDDDDAEASYNITSAIVVDGDELKIQKADLQTLGVDFTRPYRLIISTKLDDASDYAGMFPRLYFGIGTANITTNEEGIRLIVDGPNGYKKYLDLGTATSHQLTNLPKGEYNINAQKEDRVLNYNFTVTNSTPASVAVDLNIANITRWEREFKRDSEIKRKRAENNPKVLKIKEYIKNPDAQREDRSKPLPRAVVDQCGNLSPFPLPKSIPLPPKGLFRDHHFGSHDQEAQKEFFRLTKAFGEEIKLSCTVTSSANNYTYNQWLYRDVSKRCTGVDQPEGMWYYKKDLMDAHLFRPIKISYTIRDAVTNEAINGNLVTNLNSIMEKQKVTKDTITSLVGAYDIWTSGEYPYWGLEIRPYIPIPKEFKLPEASFTISAHESPHSGDNTYGVYCFIERENDINPRVDAVGSIGAAQTLTPNSAQNNGMRAFGNRLFPLDTDYVSLTSGPHTAAPDIYKAKFRVKIKPGTYGYQGVNTVRVRFRFNDESHYVDVPLTDKVERGDYLYGNIEVDIDDINGLFSYTDTPSLLDVEFSPSISGLNEEDAGARVYSFAPMFNVRKAALSASVCNNGWYSKANQISAFARIEFMSEIRKMVNGGFGFKCNDFSLPWGGNFKLSSSWKHTGHDKGLTADIRYFNEVGQQDDYDDEHAQERRDDMNKYLEFSKWAHDVADDTSVDPDTTKNKLLTACLNNGNYIAPCNAQTTFANFNHDKIVKLCQWQGEGFSQCASTITTGYHAAIMKFSRWVEYNLNALRAGTAFQAYMGGGARFAPTNPGGNITISAENRNWQRLAINKGLWPDGTRIYKQNSGVIVNDLIHYCHENDCGLSELFKPADRDHFHHIDLKLKGKVR